MRDKCGESTAHPKQRSDILQDNEILIVKQRIEGWYLAGLTEARRQKLKVGKLPNDFETVSKESFDRLVPSRFADSRVAFMQELIREYDIDTASKRCESFKYALEKHFT